MRHQAQVHQGAILPKKKHNGVVVCLCVQAVSSASTPEQMASASKNLGFGINSKLHDWQIPLEALKTFALEHHGLDHSA
jgi:hypothetical protein